MKALKSLSKVIISLVLALSLTTLTACDVLDDFFGKGEGGGGGSGTIEQMYSVTLELDGGTLSETFNRYTAGTTTALPTPTKDYYDFAGWYENADGSGSAVTQILSTDSGNKTFYAKWTPKTYSITYYVNSKVSSNESVTSYIYGVGATLPVPTDSRYVFDGWYDNSGLSGTKITSISATDYGNKTYYATSVGATFNITLNPNGGTVAGGNTMIYVFGVGATLPTPTKPANSDLVFGGWYDNSGLSGTKITSISATDSGNKVYYAKWTEPGELNAVFGGYEEGAYVEFELDSGVSLDNVSVSYKSNGGSAVTLTGDDKANLVRRTTGDIVRADIVGIKEGTCEITVAVNGETVNDTVDVTAYDRSGYAHFDYSDGVGAYNDDGTPKSNAVIVYVTEETKNTVKAKIGSSTYTGLVKILQATPKATTPVIIRVVGRIAAATWNELTYSADDMAAYPNLKGANGETLPTASSSLSQDKLISGGYNTLNTSVYSELENLSSSASWSGTKYDTCWNDCSIGGSGSKAKNVTVEGIGTDAEIFQWGMTWKYASLIEIRNLTFTDYTEDACSFQGGSAVTDSQRIWVHNCTFNEGKNYWDLTDEQDKHDGDGSTDFKWATYITISYNHYIETHKTGLIGGGGSHKTSNVTFHHNYYQTCKARLPLGRQANMHMYNNYYEGTTDTCLSLRAGAYAFVENCYFKNASNPIESRGETGATGEGTLYGAAKIYNCTFEGSTLVEGTYIKKVTDRTASVTNQNQFNQNFDTDSSAFYYDSANKKSIVSVMHNTADVPTVVPQLAGVHEK